MLTRALINDLRLDITTELEALGEKHGVNFELGRASFTSTQVTFKLIARLKGAESEEAKAFKLLANVYNLKEDYLGKTFTLSNGRMFRITGANPKAPKYPILAEELGTGKEYKFPPSAIKRDTLKE